MIVEPDFPDHWKTQLLIQLTGSAAAPLLVIRLWAHCQQRKAWHFADMSNEALAAVCRWTDAPERLRKYLEDSGFIERNTGPGTVIVHEWDLVNAQLVRNWRNGPKGGRPKTQEKPRGNPTLTDREDREEKIDRRREDRLTPPTPSGGGKRKRAGNKTGLIPDDQEDPLRERMLALNRLSIANRRPRTMWDADEVEALKKSGLLELPPEDFAADLETVMAFYAADIPREMQTRFWRRTGLLTLLRHWPGELDRARLWARQHGPQPDPALPRLSEIAPQ